MRTWSGMTSVRSRRSARRASARSDSASSARRAARRALSCACASPRRRPASLRASGSRPPRARWARVNAERLPRNSMSTWFSASLDAAPSIARAPSAVMPSMSRSTLSSAMSPIPRQVPALRRSAVRDATWRGTAAPALPEGLEADHGTGHADVERFGPPRHRDAQGAREGTGQIGGEPGGLVAQEQGRGRGPVETGIVLAVPHHRGERAEAGRRPARRPAPRVVPHGQGHVEERAGRGAHRLGVVGVDGVAGEDDQGGPRGVGRPQHGAGIARVAHVDQDHDQCARRAPTRDRIRPAAPPAWGARRAPAAG